MDVVSLFLLCSCSGGVDGCAASVSSSCGERLWLSNASQHGFHGGLGSCPTSAFALTRDWTVWMVLWTPMAHWRWGVRALFSSCQALTLGVLLPLFFVERELKLGPPLQPRRRSRHRVGVLFPAVVVGLQANHTRRSEPERRETGVLSSLRWSTSSADVFLRLEDDECHYYINRGLEMGIDTTRWSNALAGQEVTLEVVDRPAGLNWFGSVGPVRGVIFQDDTLYRTGMVRNP